MITWFLYAKGYDTQNITLAQRSKYRWMVTCIKWGTSLRRCVAHDLKQAHSPLSFLTYHPLPHQRLESQKYTHNLYITIQFNSLLYQWPHLAIMTGTRKNNRSSQMMKYTAKYIIKHVETYTFYSHCQGMVKKNELDIGRPIQYKCIGRYENNQVKLQNITKSLRQCSCRFQATVCAEACLATMHAFCTTRCYLAALKGKQHICPFAIELHTVVDTVKLVFSAGRFQTNIAWIWVDN